MPVTTLANLLNVEVFTDAVSARLGDAIRLAPLAYVENFDGQPSGTITVPKFAYIGDGVILPENTPIDPSLLTSDSDTLPVLKMAKAVNLTTEALNGSFGDPIAQAEEQIVRAIANGIEREMMTALAGATLNYTTPTGAGFVNSDTVISALGLFGEDQDGEKSLVINPANLGDVRRDQNYVENQLFDLDIIVSNRVPTGRAFIVKPEGLGLYYSKEITTLYDDDILAFSHVISSYALFATNLRNESKVVGITLTA